MLKKFNENFFIPDFLQFQRNKHKEHKDTYLKDKEQHNS